MFFPTDYVLPYRLCSSLRTMFFPTDYVLPYRLCSSLPAMFFPTDSVPPLPSDYVLPYRLCSSLPTRFFPSPPTMFFPKLLSADVMLFDIFIYHACCNLLKTKVKLTQVQLGSEIVLIYQLCVYACICMYVCMYMRNLCPYVLHSKGGSYPSSAAVILSGDVGGAEGFISNGLDRCLQHTQH